MDLSVEEANKIRVAMGMKPLPVPGGSAPTDTGPTFKEKKSSDSDEEPASTLETRSAAAYDNWRELQDEADAKAKREAKAAAIKKEREKAQRFAKLDGKGLADDAADEDDMAWLKGTKKRQKKIEKSERMRKELEEREWQAQAALQYTEADLAGVKVGHEVDDFGEGEDQILVLKDTAVDQEEEDELEAVALREKEKLQEKLDSKKRKRAYDPNDMDEAGQGSILAQYDEDIDGKKRKAFTLDGQGRTVEEVLLEASGKSKPKKVTLSLDILKDDTPVNDYMDISEIKVRKPKKKKSKSTRRKRADDDDDIFPMPGEDTAEHEAMDVDEPKATPKPKKDLTNESFVDDDDLQANLAAQRREALKKRKNMKMRPEDLARQLREEASATPDVMDTTEDADEPGLVIDETTEFVSNLQRSASEEREEERRRLRRKSSQPSNGIASMGGINSADPEGDVDTGQSYAEVEDARDRSESHARSVSVDVTGTGLDQEETVDRGLGSTLRLLKQRGVIETSENGDQNAFFRERQRFLADKQKAEAAAERLAKEQRERDRTSGKWSHMTPREREEHARRLNSQRDQLESRKLAEIFNKEYKPNVQLDYVDEFGRHMNQKEAFKHLSHQFHGKGSGNQKTQKHLDKIAAEKKRLAQSSLDTSQAGAMSNAQGQQSKKHKQAGVRLQ
ncbi:hypothetical protein K469DRAFT_707938 [Zopfia rhizophila CBS 207.26]|uniref:SART-1 protein n=1 Tax=Zopfia rhizophila CBS 207.26 TaxID=1314779 RepID=A0A6A6E023_9PEZI|nr:hypothetical protein K469DRAFT_707938 [Zopfia rhizophila CBS 207.26]